MKFAHLFATLAVLVAPAALSAQEILRVPTDKSVAAAADAFEAAVEPAGITVFARIDHGMGARMVDSDIGESQLIVFGTPRVGTPAIEANRLAALMLPLTVLVYEDTEGQVWLAYQAPADRLTGFDGIEADAPFVETMTGAVANFTRRAAE